jgi:hypothetical protein
MQKWIFFALAALYLSACAPARFVEPLEKSEQVLTGHFGGPVAKVPGIGPIPIPFTSIGYGRGITHTTTLMGALQTTSLAFGVGQFEVGASQRIWKNDRMGVSGQVNVNFLLDFYTVESQGRPNEQLWIPNFQIGHQWIRPKLSYQAEMKILAPTYSNENIVVPYPSILQNRGAMGLYFGITYRL